MVTFTYYLQRTWGEELMLARVQITFSTPVYRCDGLPLLCEALTNWKNNTEEGRQAWERSCHDFNVGDLSNYYQSPHLRPFLENEDITDLEITLTTGRHLTNGWDYDTVLIDKELP